MGAGEQHHRVARGALPPRRNDSERRAGERRLAVISLDEERRDQAERRRATDRRQPTGRRHGEAHDKLVVLVVSDQDEAARRVRELLDGAAPEGFGVTAAAPQESLARLARGGVDAVLPAMSLSPPPAFSIFTARPALGPAWP